jgi:hypothetical protein
VGALPPPTGDPTMESIKISKIFGVNSRVDECDTLHGELSFATVGAIINDGPVAVLLDGITHIAKSCSRVLDPKLGSHLLGSDALAFGKVRDNLTLRGIGVVVHMKTILSKFAVCLNVASTTHYTNRF